MVLVLCSFTNSFLAWPHGICFTNLLWGGTDKGYLSLWDSNYDWGQGLKDLVAWKEQHPDLRLKVCYFGEDPMLGRISIPNITQQEAKAKPNCYLAVSTHYMVGGLKDFLAPRQPIGRTRTYFIYDLTGTEDGPDSHGLE